MADPQIDAADVAVDTPLTGQNNWLDGEEYSALSADDRKLIGEKYKNPVEAIKGGANALRLIGKRDKSTIDIPAENDPDYEKKMAVIHEKLGRPKTPDDYQFEIPQIPEHLQGRIAVNDDVLSIIRTEAHKGGISQIALSRIMKPVMDKQIQLVQADYDARLQQAKTVKESLTKELGPNNYAKYFGTEELGADGNRINIGLVGRLLMNSGGPELYDELENTKTKSGMILGNLPALSKLMMKSADALVAEGEIDKGAFGQGGLKTPPAGQMTEYEFNKMMFPHSDPKIWGDPNDKTLHRE